MTSFVIGDGETASSARDGRSEAGLLLLFARGQRPGRDALLEALDTIPSVTVSHDPVTAPSLGNDAGTTRGRPGSSHWLELLTDGLTFDVLGLSPDPAIAVPTIRHHVASTAEDVTECEAIGVFPGPHIAHGAHALPVVRAMLRLGAALVRELGTVQAVSWPPAGSSIAPEFFSSSVEAWLKGGPFPALGLVGIVFDDEGRLRSDGLSFFTGAELELSEELSQDRLAATRLFVRLVHELVGSDVPEEAVQVTTEDAGMLTLEPDPRERLIRVKPG